MIGILNVRIYSYYQKCYNVAKTVHTAGVTTGN